MKIYFDNITDLDHPNCKFLSTSPHTNYWLVSSGTRYKREFRQLGIEYFDINSLDEPGLYFIEVNGDPQWWGGCCVQDNGPNHILSELPENIISLIKEKKIRLIIGADREGGTMFWENDDIFLLTHEQMSKRMLPSGSVLILHGNRLIEDQYNDWIQQHNKIKLFDVKSVNHFDRIFPHSIEKPIAIESIKNISAADYNSLNRTYKSHRSAHLYHIVKLDILKKGIVSANELRLKQRPPLSLLHNKVDLEEFDSTLGEHYPIYVDGDWTHVNAANSVNIDIFKNSLISFITETKFDEDVVFLTEKIFKSLAYGHPMIVLSSSGTLAALRELGYKTDWCGIDPSYNDIKDHADRFNKTHEVLIDWINLSKQEKIKRIQESLPTIQHNFSLSKQRNFYHEDLLDIISSSKQLFQ